MKALALLALCACTGTVGTLDVQLIATPGSHLLDSVQKLQLTLTQPRRTVEATRTGSGFDLAFELDASNSGGALVVKGFDANDALVACGQSPRFPESAINATLVIFMAPPLSIEVGPTPLGDARSEVAGAAISYGAVLAGGHGPTDTSASIAVYNAFNHSLVEGIAMPAARADLAMAPGLNGGVYLFGGVNGAGAPTGTLWRFDTTIPPNGSFFLIANQTDHARADQRMVSIGNNDHFLITGSPPLEYVSGNLGQRNDPGFGQVPAAATAAAPGDGNATVIFAATSLVRFRSDKFDTLTGGGDRSTAGVATLPSGQVVVIGGNDEMHARDALMVNGASGFVRSVPNVVAVPRTNPLIAVTSRYVVVVGGTDGANAPIASAEVLDAATLAPVTTMPIMARSGGFAIALPNDQVLIGGGAPASDALELFTPDPPL